NRDKPRDGSCQSTAPNLSATTPAVAAPARAWAASFFPSFQDICYDFRGILKQKTPHFIRLYKGFVGFSGSTNLHFSQPFSFLPKHAHSGLMGDLQWVTQRKAGPLKFPQNRWPDLIDSGHSIRCRSHLCS